VWLCELAATNDPDLVGQVLVAALGALPRPGLWNRPGFRDRSVYWVTTSSVGAA